MSDKAKPAHKIRHRDLVVTIWKNSNDKHSWYSATPCRVYKQNEEWKETDRFDGDDLLTLVKLLDQADSWIMNAEQSDRKAA